jgi:hypothetical protein
MFSLPSSMKIGAGVPAILKFSFTNLRGPNVGITDLRCLWFISYSVKMGLGSVIYLRSFIKIDSGIQKLIWGGGEWEDTHVDSQDR